LEKLRESVCKTIKIEKNSNYDPDEIIITVGGTEGMFVIMQTLLSSGDEVILIEPMYVYYKGWVEYSGGKCVVVNLKDDFSLDIDRIKDNITKKTKMIVINSPHNPTGIVFSKKQIKEIADIAEKHNIIVVSDEIYQNITYNGERAISISSLDGMKERTIISDSFSKTYSMDGWRIGYLAADKSLIKYMAKLHQYIISCHNTFIQHAAVFALEKGQNYIKEIVNSFNENRKLTLKYLKIMGFEFIPPQGAFYVFPSVKKFNMDSEEFADYLLREAMVAVVPGSAFGNSARYNIRISFSLPNNDLTEGLIRMQEAITKLNKTK